MAVTCRNVPAPPGAHKVPVRPAFQPEGRGFGMLSGSSSHHSMTRLPASVHRSLDMVAVIAFLAMPILLGLSGPPAMLSYALAAIHLVVTLSTKFPDTGHKLISLRAHGVVELVVGIVLIVLPWVVGWTDVARTYYVAVGVILLIVWAASNYGRQYGAERAQKAHADADRG